jgi:hypothetical protein
MSGAEKWLLSGPAGPLEALLEPPEGGPPRALAVICHPHPLHGGTLHNKVAHMLARAARTAGAAALRFNFRGVGASGGVHGDGLGEAEDAAAAIAALQQRHPGLPLWLLGFSFGACVALRRAQLDAGQGRVPARLVTVAPPAACYGFVTAASPGCPWLLLQGGADEVVDAAAVKQWAQGHAPAPRIVWMDGAGHFFHGRLTELRDHTVAFLSAPVET